MIIKQTFKRNKMIQSAFSTIVSGTKTSLIAGILAMGLVPLQSYGQDISNDESAKPASEKFNRFAIGLRGSHLYDLKFTGYDRIGFDVVGNDVWGLNGEKTRFDMAGGFDLSYFFSPLFSIDAGIDFGSMTGANDVEYYNSTVRFYSFGANLSLKRNKNVENYRWVPFARISTGLVDYDAERFFISDDGRISGESGTAFQMGIGLGMRYHITNNLHGFISTEFRTVFNDGFDGYDYGSGRDHLMQTMIGIRYTLGKGKHVDQTPAWQDARLTDAITQMQTIEDTISALQQGLISLSDLTEGELEKVAARQADLKSELKEEIAELRRRQQQKELSSNNLLSYSVFFGFNQHQLTAEHKRQLMPLVSLMRNESRVKAYVAGFTDKVGSASANERVRELRSNAVVDFFTSMGISSDRIEVLQWDNEHGYADDSFLDRRTDVIIK
jgi:outer membrane protein OmpA-like peptidoglycan-associated protein